MSFNNSMGGSHTEGAKYQPKFKDCKLEEKGGDRTLRRWITLIGSIVMNAPYGKFLEYFLDHALKRATKHNTTRPAFLDHDMFDLGGSATLGTSPHSKDTGHSLGVDSPRSRTPQREADEADSQAAQSMAQPIEPEEQRKLRMRLHTAQTAVTKAELLLEDVQKGNETGMSVEEAQDQLTEAMEVADLAVRYSELLEEKYRKSPGKSSQRPGSSSTAVTRYSDIPTEAQELDCSLFMTMLTLVDGVYYDVISNLTGPYARYTFAIIALCNHASLNQSTRRLVALNNFVEWKYNGDPSQWKMDFINFTREMYDSGATLEHLFMLYAFKSFEGKNSQVQSKISDDINDDAGPQALPRDGEEG